MHELFIELVKLQKEVIASDLKLLVILEGRDAAGKDGTIKRIIKHLSPRETKVVALGKPTDFQEREVLSALHGSPAGFRRICSF